YFSAASRRCSALTAEPFEPGCRAGADAADAVLAACAALAAGPAVAACAAGDAQAAEATATAVTGASSKDIHRRRIPDLRMNSGARTNCHPANRLVPQP